MWKLLNLEFRFSNYLLSILLFFLFFSKTNYIKKDKYRVSNKNTYGPNVECDAACL